MSYKLQLGLLKFEDIKYALKEYFQTEKNITYADGNNFSILLDGLAYNQELSNYQATQIFNELFLKTTESRRIAVEIARNMCYTPHRKIASSININNMTSQTIGTKINGIGSKTGLPYIVEYTSATNGIAYQKQLKNKTVTGDCKINQTVLLGNNISDDKIIVKVNNVEYVQYEEFDDIPNSESKIYFIEESIEQEYYTKIIFGNGVIGNIPAIDDIIDVTYYETNGTEGNEEDKIVDVENNTNLANATFSPNRNGKDNESLNEIKINANKYFNSKNRLVTKLDFENFLTGAFNAKSINVKELEDALAYYYAGNTVVSITPNNVIVNEELLTTELNKNIDASLTDSKLLTIYNNNTISYIGDLISTYSFDDTELNKKKILSTKLTKTAPSYLFVDITPSCEMFNNLILNDSVKKYYRNQLMKYLKENNFNFTSDFRLDILTAFLLQLDSNIKSVSYNIDYNIVFDYNSMISNYEIQLPVNFVGDNNSYMQLDNNFFNYSYDIRNMPDNRRTIYSILKPYNYVAKDMLFERILINDNIISSSQNNYKTVLNGNIVNNEIQFYEKYDAMINNRVYTFQIAKSLTNSNSFDVTASTVINSNLESAIILTLNGVMSPITYYYITVTTENLLGINNWNELIESVVVLKNNLAQFTMKINTNNLLLTDNNIENIKIKSSYKLGQVGYDNNKVVFNTERTDIKTVAGDDKLILYFNSIESNNEIFTINYDMITNSYITTNIKNLSAIAGYEFLQNYVSIDNDNNVYLHEKYINDTKLGIFYKAESIIKFYETLTVNNNSLDFQNLVVKTSDFLLGNNTLFSFDDIIDNSSKYYIQLKPKYIIENNKLNFIQDYNHKDGMYQLFNVNTII